MTAQAEAEAAAQETATAQEEAAAAEMQQVSCGGVEHTTTFNATTRHHLPRRRYYVGV